MNVFAYCAASFEDVTRRAAGVQPLTCPPVTWLRLDLGLLENRDLLYFDLHGAPKQDFWMGDTSYVALKAPQLYHVDLGGAVVFAANCFLADQDSPMMEALLDAGASFVIGGDGKNWGPGALSPYGLYGAPLLGLWVRRWMRVGFGPLRALALAKKAVVMRGVAVEDTLAFKAYYRRDRRERGENRR